MFVRLIIILSVIHCSKCWRCSLDRQLKYLDDYSSETSVEAVDLFTSIVDIMVKVDENLKKTCRFWSNTAVDKFDRYGFTRKICMTGFNVHTVSVQIQGRVMFTKADHLYSDRRGLLDINILPHYLNYTEATYELNSDNIIITVPNTENFLGFCHDIPSTNLITVLPAQGIVN